MRMHITVCAPAQAHVDYSTWTAWSPLTIQWRQPRGSGLTLSLTLTLSLSLSHCPMEAALRQRPSSQPGMQALPAEQTLRTYIRHVHMHMHMHMRMHSSCACDVACACRCLNMHGVAACDVIRICVTTRAYMIYACDDTCIHDIRM